MGLVFRSHGAHATQSRGSSDPSSHGSGLVASPRGLLGTLSRSLRTGPEATFAGGVFWTWFRRGGGLHGGMLAKGFAVARRPRVRLRVRFLVAVEAFLVERK